MPHHVVCDETYQELDGELADQVVTAPDLEDVAEAERPPPAGRPKIRVEHDCSRKHFQNIGKCSRGASRRARESERIESGLGGGGKGIRKPKSTKCVSHRGTAARPVLP